MNPGHVLIALKEHAEDVFALADEQAAVVFQATARVARAIRAAFGPDGMSIYQANGAAAAQTVFHFHVHVVPRWSGDGVTFAWPVQNPPREKLDEYAALIRAKMS